MNIKAKNIEIGMVINDSQYSQYLVISKISKDGEIKISTIKTLLNFQFHTTEVFSEDDLLEVPFDIGSNEYLDCVGGMLQTALRSLITSEFNIRFFRKMVSCA